jgi:hypothetical protein
LISYNPVFDPDDQATFEEAKSVHAGHVTQILDYFWSNNIPAATKSYFDDLLPLRGGNDEEKVFWKDDTKRKTNS